MSINPNVLGNNRGITILYVLAALILAVAIGSALMKMAAGEVNSSGDYASMQSAMFAARSGLQAAEAYCIDNPTAAATIFQNYLDTSNHNANKNCLCGTLTNPLTVTGTQQKYCVQIVGFDQTNFIAALKSTGFGKNGSRKEITGYYLLNNIINTAVINTPKQALYLGGGTSGGASACALYVNGSTFARVPWNSPGTANTKFSSTGDFWLSDNVPPGGPTGAVPLDGTVFNGRAYFGRPVNICGSNWGSGGRFGGKTFFNSDVNISSDVGNCIPLADSTWFNGNLSGANDISSRHLHWPTGAGQVFGLSNKTYSNGFPKSHNWPFVWNPPLTPQGTTPYDPLVCLGMSAHTDPPDVNMDLSAAMPYNFNVSGSASLVSIRNQYNSTTTSTRLNGTFAVMTFTGSWNSDATGGSAITGNCIIRITAPGSNTSGNSAGALCNVPGSVILLYIDIGAGNTYTIDLGTFYGIIYVNSGNPIFKNMPSSATNLNGCFYAAPGTCPTFGINGGGTATFTWNSAVVNTISTLGVFGSSSGTINWTNFSGLSLKGIHY